MNEPDWDLLGVVAGEPLMTQGADMNLTERVAAAMYETPDPADPNLLVPPWPPTHEEDLAWWLTLAQTAINTIKES